MKVFHETASRRNLLDSFDEENKNEIIHPHVIIQDDILNNSRITTTVVCEISTNMKKAYSIGNIILDLGEGNLLKKSTIVVSHISNVNKNQIGTLSQERINEIFQGMKQIQRQTDREQG